MIKDKIVHNSKVVVNEDKFEIIKNLFSNCFDKNGNFDIATFEQEINGKVNIVKEGYELNFLGKQYAKLLAALETETIIKPDTQNNQLPENETSENIYITGDNIDALKHLVKSYSNKIKCIYIDPPYNTGSDGFIYNDKFSFNLETLMNKLDVSEEEAKRIMDMTNKGSSSHSAWLTFMYPRLYLAKQLLKEDGVIFISIDDNEQANLKLLCDNLFGEENFVGNIIQNKGNAQNDAINIQKNHDYIIVYQKIRQFNSGKEIAVINKNDYKPQEVFKDEHGYYYKGSSIVTGGAGGTLNKRRNLGYTIYYNPNTGDKKAVMDYDIDLALTSNDETKVYQDDLRLLEQGYIIIRAPKKGNLLGCWTWSLQKFDNSKNELMIVKNGSKYSPYKKMYVPEEETYSESGKVFYKNNGNKNSRSIWEYSSSNGTEEFVELFGTKYFDNPKNIEMLMEIVNIAANQNSIILDFFSGSATTAHAVMQLNAEDGGNRRYIMVQLPEPCKSDSEAYKAGYKTIDEIGQERIRRAAKKIKEETNADIDYGFKHYSIEGKDANTLDKLEKFQPNFVLSEHTIVDEFGVPSILTTWMIEDGYGLMDQCEVLDLEGYKAYKYANTIYLIDGEMGSDSIKTLVEKYELDKDFDCNRIVLFGYSFNLTEIQTLKDNIKQIKHIKGIDIDIITRY